MRQSTASSLLVLLIQHVLIMFVYYRSHYMARLLAHGTSVSPHISDSWVLFLQFLTPPYLYTRMVISWPIFCYMWMILYSLLLQIVFFIISLVVFILSLLFLMLVLFIIFWGYQLLIRLMVCSCHKGSMLWISYSVLA